MRRVSFWRAIYRCAAWLQYLAAACATLVGAVQRTKPENWGDIGRLLKWGQENAWWLIVASALCIIISRSLCDWIGKPWVWDAVQSTLDRFREEVFKLPSDAGIHENRITLFRKVTWVWWLWPFRSKRWPWGQKCWPNSGWLVPVVRTGHLTQKTNVVFLAPDNADDAEGVAGITWVRNSQVRISTLPDLRSANVTDDEIVEYARSTFVAERWVRSRLAQNQPCPRALCGIPVHVGGKLWGVIVLDSRYPDSIKFDNMAKMRFDLLTFYLAELLKRV